jgi:probable F420-dependent oxidoreductase
VAVRAGVRFGLYMSQTHKSWAQILAEFQTAEELGFDSAWVADHLHDFDDPTEPATHTYHESWTLLSAIAAQTSRIRIGVLVTNNGFRHPALLAKAAVTVDHVSGGRLTLGLGAGWNELEHRRFGFDFPPAAERVARFEEAAQIIDGLMRHERFTFAGRYYQIEEARLQPPPLQQPRIPLLIAAHRPRALRVAARYADQWDTFGAIAGTSTEGVRDDVAQRVRRFEEACREFGRDPLDVRRSISPKRDDFASTAEFVSFVRRHRALGFTDFLTAFPPPGWAVQARDLAATIPALRHELDASAAPEVGSV